MKAYKHTREHCYELPSAAIVEHWWSKFTLAQLKREAQQIRQKQKDSVRGTESNG